MTDAKSIWVLLYYKTKFNKNKDEGKLEAIEVKKMKKNKTITSYLIWFNTVDEWAYTNHTILK